tara:strand:- start:495 stop:662 length:168 start_codon:yes stop_codon:yes gene_type:complete
MCVAVLVTVGIQVFDSIGQTEKVLQRKKGLSAISLVVLYTHAPLGSITNCHPLKY